MKLRQSIFLVTALAMLALLVACSSSSGSNTPPPPPAISIAFTGTVPTSLVTNQQFSLTATVSNDSSNGGVNWTVTCSGADCGSFNPASTASGSATTYTAPASATSVTVTATAADSSSATASATITVAPPSLADGNYVFSVTGLSAASGSPYPFSVAGVLTVSSGLVTAGEQDFNNAGTIETDLINPSASSITTTSDGNLQITLVTCLLSDCTQTDTGAGFNGTETFNGSFTCTCKALLTEFDQSATGSGTLDEQTSTTTTAEGYAFSVNGVSIDGNLVLIGGILDVAINGDGSGTIDTANSVFDANDFDLPGPMFAETFASGSVSIPDSLGRVTFTLNPTDSADFDQILLGGYIVDDTRIRLVEGNDTFGGTTGGSALGQGINTGNFGSGIAGNSYVLGLAGYDGNGPLQAAGVLTTGTGGNQTSGPVTATISYNDLVDVTATPSSAQGTYTVDPTGRVTISNLTDNNVTVNFQLYLTGDGHATAISMDLTHALAGLGFGQTGSGSYSAASFSGGYALNATGADGNLLGPYDAIGQVSADGIGAFSSPSGTGVDLNWLFETGPVPDLAVSGTFSTTADTATSGVFSGTMTGLDVTNGTTTADAFTYYAVTTAPSSNNPQTVVGIETDFNQLTLDYFEFQQF